MKQQRYYIYCDESIKKGKYYSNFYGGAMINVKNYNLITDVLIEKRDYLFTTTELKWQKINSFNKDIYIDCVDTFFDFIQSGKIKIRIMFTDNRISPALTDKQKQNEFLILYYQFLKHSFGLRFLSNEYVNNLELFIDKLPDNENNRRDFVDYLMRIQNLKDFQKANIQIKRQQISEVDSKNHIIMQYLDIVLGAMAFRMNKMHLTKNPDTLKRGKRTIAKEKVYKHINKRIRLVYPNFNVGITTGKGGDFENILHMPYRHWVFKSK